MKNKILNIVLTCILTIYPLSLTASAVYALPELPSLPSTPTTPTNPPQLPENAPQTEVTISNEPAQTDNPTDQTNETPQSIEPIDSNQPNTTSGSNIESGSADINTNQESSSIENINNEPVVSIADLESSNNNTGETSENNSMVDVENSSNTQIDNNANLDNLVTIDSDSGTNLAIGNTGDGIIYSGDSDVIFTAINAANNLNVGLENFNVFDDQTGDIVIDFGDFESVPLSELLGNARNNTTGANSENNATNSLNNTNTLFIDNNGNIVNSYLISSNTGNNIADKNTGDGSITTGDANVVFNLINFLNNSFQGLGELLIGNVNIFGTLVGDIVLQDLQGCGTGLASAGFGASNNTTGANSGNSAATSITNTNDASLINLGDINNNVTVDAATGGNTADKNTLNGQVITGDSNAKVVTTNIANTNTLGTGGTIWLVLTNNLGQWSGQLFNTNSSIFSPFFTFFINPDGTFSATNSNTGADSTNDASIKLENSSDVRLSNSASVTNNIVIDANTGNNSASKNTGNGSIQTGDANVAANILNIINNNFMGSRVLLTIVNIFGKFLGNIRDGKATVVTQNPPVVAFSETIHAVSSSNNFVSSTNWVQQSVSGNSVDDNKTTKNIVTVLGSSSNDQTNGPVDYVSADRGLFDEFKLTYLVIPLVLASLLVIVRRVLVRR